MKPLSPLRCLALGLLIAAPAVLAQAGSGDRYRVTSSMEMPGMAMSMPGMTSEVCTARNQASEQMVPMDKNCQLLDYKVSGNKSSFHMRCTGESAMEGRGEFERLGPDAYRGKMDVTAEGQRMIMRFEGKRIGVCDYAKESPEAQGRAMMAQSCGEMLRAEGNPYMLREHFLGSQAMCASDKPKFCARVTPIANDPAALRAADEQDRMLKDNKVPTHLWEALAGCGMPRATVVAKACDRAQAGGDFSFVADYCPDRIPRLCPQADAIKHPAFLAQHCPVQAKAAAAQHCVSRGFTAGIDGPYVNFCNRMSAERLRGGSSGQPAGDDGQGDAGREAPKPEEEEKKKPSWRDRLRDVIG